MAKLITRKDGTRHTPTQVVKLLKRARLGIEHDEQQQVQALVVTVLEFLLEDMDADECLAAMLTVER